MLNLKNTLDGYLKNVEVIGNTIQDANNLANIRSVGDKVEGQELYKIDVVSCGKNLFDKTKVIKDTYPSETTGELLQTALYGCSDFINVKPNTNYKTNSSSLRYAFYDQNKKFISGGVSTNFNSPSNASFIRVCVKNGEFDIYQLEEGTQTTPYEPYKGDKIEILSPVQLEKVGDVSDRIICKDGVWGIEKNIKDYVLNTELISSYFDIELAGKIINVQYYVNDCISDAMVDTKHKCNINDYVKSIPMDDRGKSLDELVCWSSKHVAFIAPVGMFGSLQEFKASLPKNINMKYITVNPQFIPLPHDQQVKLRTFAGQTNIAFLTEIAGQIKAQVPKSLGATVNTHTEQIADLHNSLDRVKKLEETTVSTVETESGFTTVDATSNGYFEDVKLEGKTLVNLCKTTNCSTGNYVTDINIPIKGNQDYTIYGIIAGDTARGVICTTSSVELQSKPGSGDDLYASTVMGGLGSEHGIPVGNSCIKITSKEREKYLHIRTGGYTTPITYSNLVILEGDYTNNPPEYFEGLMSVGQDVEEVSVESVNVNLFDRTNIMQGGFIWSDGVYYPTSTDRCCTKDYIKVEAGMTLYRNKKCAYMLYDKDYMYLGNNYVGNKNPSNYINTPYIVEQDVVYIHIVFSPTDYGGNVNDIIFDDTMISTSPITEYTPHQSNKKHLLYYNPTTETWEKPILREWDTIEKHSDGKYYYHKRSGEVVLNGSDNIGWRARTEVGLTNFIRFSTTSIDNKSSVDINVLCDKFNGVQGGEVNGLTNVYNNQECIFSHNDSDRNMYITISTSKLSTQDVAGFKAWLKANPTTVVYQLAQEEVYECTNIDLMTYSGETNYIINSGAISPKSLLKVHNNISNVVKILQEKVSLLENTFIAGLKSVLSGDMYSLATILYPEDFEQNDNTEQDIMVIPE